MVNNDIKTDARVKKINDLLIQFSHGDFLKKISPSKKFDEIDAIMYSLNMLGEEMNATVISKNYFIQIYDSIKEMVFEIDKNGIIINCNKAVSEKLGWGKEELQHKKLDQFLRKTDLFDPVFNFQEIKKPKNSKTHYLELLCKNKTRLYCICQFQPFNDEQNKKIKFLLTANNISKEVEVEKASTLALLNAQELERTRLAKDLHDSIGQQLSAIKLYFGSINNSINEEAPKAIIDNCDFLLNNIAQEIRTICFDLLPRTLASSGLISAIKELVQQLNASQQLEVIISIKIKTPKFTKEQELVVYRVIQEFINNSIKHSGCSKITITFDEKLNKTHIIIKDNGKGFNMKKVLNKADKGIGLFSMKNRIKSINGDVQLSSVLNTGTQLQILL